MIKQLTKETTQNLCAQQVITSINDCIKQLIDNSIDAHSHRIEIQLYQYGKAKIKVKDDGCGISCFQEIGQKGSTSKNKGDLNQVKTLGFRGQALHSIANISQHMFITSTHNKVTHILDLKTKNIKKSNVEKEEAGTEVQIDNLFQYLPVRRYQLLNRYKQFFKKIDEMIKQYSLVYENVSFIFKNYREGKQDILIQTSGMSRAGLDRETTWIRRIKEVLGLKITQNLMFMKTSSLEGWILKNIESGSSKQNAYIKKNMQYCYLNKRPIDTPSKISAVFDQYYRKYNKGTKYVFIINICVPSNCVDVNLTPNKRQILIKQSLLQQLVVELKQFIEKNVIQTIPVLQQYEERLKSNKKIVEYTTQIQKNQQEYYATKSETKQRKKQMSPKQEQPRQLKSSQQKLNVIEKKQESIKKQKQQNKKEKEDIKLVILQTQGEKGKSKMLNLNELRQQIQSKNKKSKIVQELNKKMSIGRGYNQQRIITKRLNAQEDGRNEMHQQRKLVNKNEKMMANESNHFGEKAKKDNMITQRENQIKFIEKELKTQREEKQKQQKLQNQIGSGILNLSSVLDKKTQTLSKEQFQNFSILGQFNHGFIVCLYGNSYYLVDQHAASEKFHFQKILNSKRNKAQLFEDIQLSLIQLENLEEHKNILEKEGFLYDSIDSKIVLKQAPIFLGKIYGKQYFHEILATGKSLSQIQDFYMAAATKACRTAIMIGDVLQLAQMKNIVHELRSLESPWNCPHGRPTLIYLGQRQNCQQQIECRSRQYSLEIQ